MKNHTTILSENELLMFTGFIKEEDNSVSLLFKHSKKEIEMYICNKVISSVQ